MRSIRLLPLLCLTLAASAQAPDANPYARRNTFTTFAEYSNDSSHIILGSAPDRKLAAAGVQYERRLVASPYLTWSYVAEFRPFLLSSDPVATTAYTVTSTDPKQPPYSGTNSGVFLKCASGSLSSSYTNPVTGVILTIDDSTTCSRQHTFAQGLSPIGFRINLRPRHPLQLTFSSNGGYMYSNRPIPIPGAGSFNFHLRVRWRLRVLPRTPPLRRASSTSSSTTPTTTPPTRTPASTAASSNSPTPSAASLTAAPALVSVLAFLPYLPAFAVLSRLPPTHP